MFKSIIKYSISIKYLKHYSSFYSVGLFLGSCLDFWPRNRLHPFAEEKKNWDIGYIITNASFQGNGKIWRKWNGLKLQSYVKASGGLEQLETASLSTKRTARGR